MRYKVRITRIVGDISVTYEVETEDKSFIESFIAKDREKDKVEVESKVELEELIKELQKRETSTYKPIEWELCPFGEIWGVKNSYTPDYKGVE